MRWLVTLSASKRDVERLAAVSLAGLSADPSDSRQLILELQDPEGDATGDDAPHAANAVIDVSVRHINGVGKLRWGAALRACPSPAPSRWTRMAT